MHTLDDLLARHDDAEDRAQLRSAILETGRQRFRHYDRALQAEAQARAALVKRCPSCDQAKEAAAFGANAARPDGLQVQCRACRRTPVSQ